MVMRVACLHKACWIVPRGVRVPVSRTQFCIDAVLASMKPLDTLRGYFVNEGCLQDEWNEMICCYGEAVGSSPSGSLEALQLKHTLQKVAHAR